MACAKWIRNENGIGQSRCGEPTAFAVVPGHGLETENSWEACEDHAPVSHTVDLIDVRAPQVAS